MNFSIVIPSKDREPILKKTLDKLRVVSNLADMQVIIVNDSDNDISILKDYAFVEVYKNNGQGAAFARNLGASKAKYNWLIFMDDDMLVQPYTFEKLHFFYNNQNNCLLANWVYPEFLQQQYGRLPFLRYLRKYGFDSLEGWSSDVQWNKETVFKVNGITSQFLMIHKDVFFRAGAYNTAFPFAGFEDYDFSKRLRQQGVEIYVDPHNLVYHNEADRLDIENWLERKKRGGITRKVAVSEGYQELALQYSLPKKFIYKLFYSFRKPVLQLLKSWPPSYDLDRLFFLLVNVLLGTYVYIGYTGKLHKAV